MLEVVEINVYYGAVHALNGVSFHVDAGEIVTLIGANGAGKTTTLRTVSGLLRPSSGSIRFRGQEITQVPPHKVVAMGLGHALQGHQVFPALTVRENLELGAFTRRDTAGIADSMEWVFQIFPRLRERIGQLGGTLSGGEQQMLSMGRALMGDPQLMLLDEPSFGLAPLLVEQIFDVIQEINRRGTGILLIEQNAVMALSVAKRGYVIESGKIVLQGGADELRENPLVRAAYLGES